MLLILLPASATAIHSFVFDGALGPCLLASSGVWTLGCSCCVFPTLERPRSLRAGFLGGSQGGWDVAGCRVVLVPSWRIIV